MAKYAIIDIGSNSIKFHIGERHADGTWGVVLDKAELARLGEGLQGTGEISTEALDRNVKAVSNMVAEARNHGVAGIAAVGTMALRTAKNSNVFVKKVEESTGVTVEVITGDEESRLSFLAVKSGIGLSEGTMTIFDTGGGSTEFVFGKGERVETRFSLNVGAIRFTEKILLSNPVTGQELRAAKQAITEDLAELDKHTRPQVLVGMGGTVTNIAGVKHQLAKYDPDIVQGSTIEKAEIDRQVALYQSKTIEERRAIVGLQPKRADVILAGVCIVQVIMEKLGAPSFFVSDRGLRHGLLVDRFGR